MTQEMVTTLTAGCFLSFAWATHPKRPAVVQVLSAVTAAIHLYAIWIGASWLGGWEIIPLVTSWVLFWWAMAAAAHQNLASQDLPTEGPYRWIRHPRYLSYLLVWISGPFASGSPVLFVTAGLWSAFYVAAAIGEDKNLLNGPLGEKYKTYQQRTGLLLPRTPFNSAQRKSGPPNAKSH
jgi:protein-S-isoprenylcysteine O-methyltransferase Ste14